MAGAVQFPPAQFLLGVGQADSRPQATEQAYAALSRIFKAEITAQAKDWESYLVVETRGAFEHRTSIDLGQCDSRHHGQGAGKRADSRHWFDRKTRQYYALAGMNRAQAESAMVERLAELGSYDSD